MWELNFAIQLFYIKLWEFQIYCTPGEIQKLSEKRKQGFKIARKTSHNFMWLLIQLWLNSTLLKRGCKFVMSPCSFQNISSFCFAAAQRLTPRYPLGLSVYVGGGDCSVCQWCVWGSNPLEHVPALAVLWWETVPLQAAKGDQQYPADWHVWWTGILLTWSFLPVTFCDVHMYMYN